MRFVVVTTIMLVSAHAYADEEKSPKTATAIAVGATASAIAIGAVADGASAGPGQTTAFVIAYGGLVIGPSLGHLYAGETGHAVRWTAIRALSLAAAASGAYLVLYGEDGAPFGGGLALTALGVTGLAVGVTWDLADAHRAAQRANRRSSEATIGFVPIAHRNGAGLRLVGVF